ncbi:MAG: tetratricopeptide repeat protein, partial [Proteobacteria bacterium]|nr:tetratricopeptide repeat protein [Candidatus Fonsibacter sp. PEL5]
INSKNLKKSIPLIEDLIKNFPDDFFLENFYGTVLLNIKEYQKAEKYFELSIKNNSKYTPAYFNLGLLFYENKQYHRAIKNFLTAIDLDNRNYQALFHIALSYENLELNDDAIKYFLKLLELEQNNAEILFKIANCYVRKNDYKNAIFYLEKCLVLNPRRFEYLYLIGYYHRALKIRQTPEVYHGIAGIYKELRFLDLALENYEKCLIINPNYSPALNNIASIKSLKNSFFDAFDYLEKYLQLGSISPEILTNVAQANFAVLNFDKGLEYFERSINHNSSEKNYEKYLFSTLYLEDFNKDKYFNLSSKFSELSNKKKVDTYKVDLKNNNLIIGFVSGDFREHAVSYQITGLIRELKKFHDLKLFAYYNNNYEDNKTKELKSYFHKFENIFEVNDDELIKKIVEDKVNILIDLSGYSSLNRLSVFTAKPAPIQITAFGFLKTTGLKEIDYIIGDQNILISDNDFTEKVLKIKEIWSTLDINNIFSQIQELPQKKNKYITFGAFNNFNKLNKNTLILWSEILKNVPGSKIFFNNYTYEDSRVRNFLYLAFEKNNIKKNRILIENGGNREKILKDYNKIDILLDTYPYGGGTTSLEAAWMCVPILTISGANFVSRGATSVNQSLGMSDWNCTNGAEYLEKAIKFSNDVNSLEKLKSELILKRMNNKIFDNVFYARNFYSLMREVWNKYLENNI